MDFSTTTVLWREKHEESIESLVGWFHFNFQKRNTHKGTDREIKEHCRAVVGQIQSAKITGCLQLHLSICHLRLDWWLLLESLSEVETPYCRNGWFFVCKWISVSAPTCIHCCVVCVLRLKVSACAFITVHPSPGATAGLWQQPLQISHSCVTNSWRGNSREASYPQKHTESKLFKTHTSEQFKSCYMRLQLSRFQNSRS